MDWLKEQWQEAFGGSLGQSVGNALTPEKVNFFGLMVNPSLITSVGVSVLMILAAAAIRIFIIPRFKKIPGGFQILLENMVGYFDKKSVETVHRQASFVGPYVYASALFIAIGTLIELLGVRPALASINSCFALGLTTFIVINIAGFHKKGFGGRIKRYKPLMGMINAVTDLAVPLSLSLRLFGSITSGFIIMELLYSLWFTSLILPAAVAVMTTIFHAGIQAYLFATLTNAFTAEALE
jgi:F0F1-type ATP synthase, subunit a